MANELEKYLEELRAESTRRDRQNEEVVEPNMSVGTPASFPERKIAQAEDLELEEVNQEAKSPYQETKAEKAPEFDPNVEYLDLIKRYKEELDAPTKAGKGDEFMNYLTGIGQAASLIQAPGAKKMAAPKYWGDQQKAKRAAAKKAKLGTMKDLAGLLKGYKDKKSIEGKVFQTRSGLVQIKDGVPTPIYEDPYMKSTADIRKESLGLREEKFEFKKGETEKTRMEKVVKEFNADPVMRDSKKAVIAAEKARSIIQKGGKMAPAVMGRLLARMAGEVGVMTDQDVASFKGSAQWSDSMERFFQRGIMGTLTETDKSEMTNMVDRLSAIEAQAIEGYADNISRQYSRAAGVDREGLLKAVLPKKAKEIYKTRKAIEMSDAPYGEEVKRNGKTYRWNPSINKYQLK